MKNKNKDNNCICCGNTTGKMYRLNKGVFCEDHVEVALIQQKIDVDLQNMKDRIRIFKKMLYPCDQ